MKKHVRTIAGPLFVLVILVVAARFLQQELRHYGLREFLDGLTRIPASRLGLAIALTVLNYLILIGYDYLGVKYLGHSLHLAKVALGSFVGYCVGHNFGTLFGGSTIRYRLYSSWGLSAVEIVKLVLILGVTFWIGLFALAGFVFIWEPIDIPSQWHLYVSDTRPLGFVLAGLAVAYLVLCAVRRAPIRIGRWEFSPPRLGLSLMQYAVATLDLLVVAAVLYVLLPESIAISYWHFLAAYLLTLVAVYITQVPGGLGVLELGILTLLNPAEPEAVVGALLAFRAIYYLGPLAIGLFVLAAHEFWIHGKSAR